MTDLTQAVEQGDARRVAQLLAAGLEAGVVPLLIAAERNHAAIVGQLLAAGADVNRANARGSTPLFAAVYNGHTAVVEQLLAAGADANQAHQVRSDTPLLVAARTGHAAIVAQLLKRGADVHRRNSRGDTPLLVAADNGHGAIVAQLLDASQGADVHDDALVAAARNGYAGVVRALLCEGGADVDNDALAAATQNGHGAVAQQLLDKGADVTRKGVSRLFIAAMQGDGAAVEEHKGAGDVRKAAVVAAQNGHAGVVAQLLVHPDQPQSLLYAAAEHGRTAVVQLLLEQGAVVEPPGSGWIRNGRLPLRDAAKNGHLSTVELLLNRGAHANDAIGSAAQHGRTAVVELLLRWGASSHRALVAAQEAEQYEVVSMLRLLTEAIVADDSPYWAWRAQVLARRYTFLLCVRPGQRRSGGAGLPGRLARMVLEEWAGLP